MRGERAVGAERSSDGVCRDLTGEPHRLFSEPPAESPHGADTAGMPGALPPSVTSPGARSDSLGARTARPLRGAPRGGLNIVTEGDQCLALDGKTGQSREWTQTVCRPTGVGRPHDLQAAASTTTRSITPPLCATAAASSSRKHPACRCGAASSHGTAQHHMHQAPTTCRSRPRSRSGCGSASWSGFHPPAGVRASGVFVSSSPENFRPGAGLLLHLLSAVLLQMPTVRAYGRRGEIQGMADLRVRPPVRR